jgi:hypothetical protein
MNGIRAAAAAVFVAFTVFCTGAGAQSQAADPAVLQAAVEEARARLNLTPEQEAQLKPLVQERNQSLKAIRDKYAGDDSRRARRAMFKEAQPVVENYQARVRTILDDAQVAEWEKMRAEARERLKAQYKKKGGAPE